MTDDTPETPSEPATPPDAAPQSGPKSGDRIAKVLARAGLASRRDAEKLIAAGRVAVNGRVIDSPALDIGPKDRVTVDGQPIPEAEPPRLWLYHKPPGLVTTEKDEEGRPTVFDSLPEGLPRVMSVGRLDITSEGLLLLTNDGEIKRRLELPSTGWLRKYRVRVNGTPDDASLEPLRQGLTVDGTAYQPMQVVLDRQQGANAWLTVGLREGKNREVRRAMEAVGLTVNRLIRISYGPFRLEDLEPGQVEEVRPRVLRDQLGLEETPGVAKAGRTVRALKPAADGSAGKSPKPAFAARTGKAGWLADPSASGRARPGPKGPGKARAIDDKGPTDAPRARKPRAAGAAAGKPSAAGTRSASPAAKGPARTRPAWGDAPRDRAADDSAPRLRKPRAAKSGSVAGTPHREDRDARGTIAGSGATRPPRAAAGASGGKPTGRPGGKSSGDAFGRRAGDRGPRPAHAATKDADDRTTARPKSPRADSEGAERGPRSGARSWGAKSHAAPGTRGPRKESARTGDAPRPPRAEGQDAGAGGRGRPRTAGSAAPKGDRTGKSGYSARKDASRADRAGDNPAGGKAARGKPAGDRARGPGSAGTGSQAGGPKRAGFVGSPGAAARGAGRGTGPGGAGPKGGSSKGGPTGGGPRGGGPRGSGPKGGKPQRGGSGGGPKGGRSGGGGSTRD